MKASDGAFGDVDADAYDGPVPEPTREGAEDSADGRAAAKTDDDADEEEMVYDQTDFNRDARAKDATSMFHGVPQRECPGRPTKKSLRSGQPRKNAKLIERKLELLAEEAD